MIKTVRLGGLHVHPAIEISMKERVFVLSSRSIVTQITAVFLGCGPLGSFSVPPPYSFFFLVEGGVEPTQKLSPPQLQRV